MTTKTLSERLMTEEGFDIPAMVHMEIVLYPEYILK
jgi:hypothetical protein